MLGTILLRIAGCSEFRAFVDDLAKLKMLLDIGCAGGSPHRIKGILSLIDFYGVEIIGGFQINNKAYRHVIGDFTYGKQLVY